MPVPAGKSHPPPARISHTGTTVWTHQASSCSSSGSISNACFSTAALPRRLALHLRCEPNNCQSCCRVKFTLVDLLELPRANISGLTLWPMRGMSLVMSLPLCRPLQEVNVIVTGSSSTGGTKMGIIHDYI